MTFTMMFDGTTTEERGRPSALGEAWTRWMRALVSFLRSESGSAGGAPPEKPPEEPPELVARQAAESGEKPSLASAYDVKLYRPTYEPLMQPEPPPNTQPPDQPDPPPSGYTLVGEIEDQSRPWPAVVLGVLGGIFGDKPPPTTKG